MILLQHFTCKYNFKENFTFKISKNFFQKSIDKSKLMVYNDKVACGYHIKRQHMAA